MKNKLSLFSIPYVIWMALFTVAPIVMVVVYAFTNAEGSGFTMENFANMGDYAVVFGRSFKLAFVADFIGESNIIDGIMRADGVVEIFNRRFTCLDKGFDKDEPVDVVIRPEDVDIVPENKGQLKGTVTNVTFKGMQYDIIVDFYGFKWLIQTTDLSPVGSRIGIKIDPDGIHIMKKSKYSGMFGDYSSFSEEYDELDDASLELDEEESGDEE